MKRKILFVINTLSRAGAEKALLELLRKLNPEENDISLLILMGQGELASEIPEYVHICNKEVCDESVLTATGRWHMIGTILKAMFSYGTIIRRLPFLVRQCIAMLSQKEVSLDKLLWPILADGTTRLKEEYDLAVAFLEGGSAYYVADHVRARKKVAFLHIDYKKAGYNRQIDGSCYLKFDRIFTVSEEIQEPFYEIYPELRGQLQVFRNILDTQTILQRAKEPGGFPDDFSGIRILSVGRLNTQKAFEYSIDAMKLLKDSGVNARWYVLGEGNRRAFLKKRIHQNGLDRDFILVGAVENPYPWFAQTDLYVHCSRYEGKSIAIQEAQLLGCAMLVSDYSSNRSQVTDGVDGRLCTLDPADICRKIQEMLNNPEKTESYRRAAAQIQFYQHDEEKKLFAVLD